MQLVLTVKCNGCDQEICRLGADTADGADKIGQKVLDQMEKHRERCYYYGREVCEAPSKV